MMRYNNYHKHDHLSNLYTPDSNTKAEEYIKKCIEYGHDTYFTTNHGTMGDIFEAVTLCKKYGIRCLSGLEGYIVPDASQKDNSNYHIMIIPRTNKARKKVNLISSHAHIDGFYYKPRLFLDDLLTLDKNDIYITTACCAGIIRDDRGINEIFLPLYEHFGDNVLLEIQNHLAENQKRVNRKALELHSDLGLRLIAANDSHYVDDAGRIERDNLLKGRKIDFGDEETFILDYPDYDTFFERFQKQGIFTDGEIEEAIKNTLIFDECEEIQLDKNIKMPTIYPNLTLDERVDELKKIINKKFHKIVKQDEITKEELPKYLNGIRYEMKIIEDTNDEIHTADYFLLNEKIVDLAVNKYNGVLTRGGRGSCASFYINRILGMTQLDRFRINLPIFPDRFASTARLLENKSLPDIDYNVKDQEPFVKATRELLGKYGCFPMVSYGLMQESEAFRTVCRLHGIEHSVFNEIAKNLDEYKDKTPWDKYYEESQKYIGTIISGSVHPCSFCLDNKNIMEEYGVVRLGDNICVLLTSSEADEYKILKNDYLMVTVWAIISETFKEIGQPIMDARHLLQAIENDERVWDLFAKGLTATLNQVDSDNGQQQAMQYGIHSFEDGAFIAGAIRPSFDAWREKFLNHEDYSTGSKDLDNVLNLTKHYIIYQENLMQYFDWLGISPAESIGLIKKISKKKIKPDDFQKLEIRLKENWIKQTGSDEHFEETWKMIQGCMSYGFASGHAAATSLDMCYGAYLKAHYPLEYYTVCLNIYKNDIKKTTKLISELPYFNIKLMDIKFRKSKGDYFYDKSDNTIYKGIGSVKYINNNLAEELYELRDNQYDSFIDLLIDIKEKTSCKNDQIDILTKLNFFNEFGEINILLKKIELFNKLYNKKQFKKTQIESEGIPVWMAEKYAVKMTEKLYKFSDTLPLLKELSKNIVCDKTTKIDIIKYEIEYLGSANTKLPHTKECYYIVQDIKGEHSKIVTLYQLKTGEVKTIKIRKGRYSRTPIEIGDVLNVYEISKDKKYIPDGVDESGKLQFKRSEEMEELLTGYSIINK